MNSPLQSDPWIGRLLGEHQRYRLERVLGIGGMGDVFVAVDTLLANKQVALKLLKGNLVTIEAFRKRFEREVALCAALKGDHIVQVHDYGVTTEGYPFYVMEYLTGETLGQRLEREKRLSPEESISIINQVCAGLQVAHEGVTLRRESDGTTEHVKIIHRDLKPDNIFLVNTMLGSLAKILDFGIAKVFGDRQDGYKTLTEMNMFIGTFHYAAPERLENENTVDGRADIYSLGIVLYEMLSGNNPFGLDLHNYPVSDASWIVAHTTKPIIPLRSQPGCEQLSADLEAVVMRCLQKSPDDRFVSVVELSRALKALVPKIRTNEAVRTQPLPQSSTDRMPGIPLPEQLASPDATTISVPLGSHTPDRSADVTMQLMPLSQTPKQGDSQIPLEPSTATSNAVDATMPLSQIPKRASSRVPIGSAADDRDTAYSNPQHGAPPPDTATTQPVTPFPTELVNKNTLLHSGKLLLLLAGIVVALGAIATGVLYHLQEKARENETLSAITSLQTQAKYRDCITQAQAIASSSDIYNKAQITLNQCQLGQAKKLAAENKFADALKLAGAIPQPSSTYPEAQVAIASWSKQAMTQATAQYQSGKLDLAIAQLKAIPTTSPTYPEAKAAIAQWQKDWQVAETQFQAATAALKANNPQAAIDAANKIPKISFWQEKVKPVVRDADSLIAKQNIPPVVNPEVTTPSSAPEVINSSPESSQPATPPESSKTETPREDPPSVIVGPRPNQNSSQNDNGI